MLFFAHAGEVHEDQAGSFMHYLENWYVSLPLFALVTIAVAIGAFYMSKRSHSAAFIVLAVYLLLAGVLSYSWSSLISTLALALGFGLVLFQVFVGLKK